MSTHDFVVDNQNATSFRADLNAALAALVTQNSNATAPTTTFANMIWYDTATNILKKRNEANSAWISLGTIDETAGTFTPTGGTVAIASQAEAEAGTDNTKMMTPLRVAQAIDGLAGYSTVSIYASSSSFVTPAGVTSALVIVVGGGGGGGGDTSGSAGESGGRGGVAAGVISVSGTITVTVGAGGNGGSSAGSGTAGGSSSFSTLSATGGGAGTPSVAGADGDGTGGSLRSAMYPAVLAGVLATAGALSTPLSVIGDCENDHRLPGAGSAAIAYSVQVGYAPGSYGSGKTASNTAASGGVGGAVIVIY